MKVEPLLVVNAAGIPSPALLVGEGAGERSLFGYGGARDWSKRGSMRLFRTHLGGLAKFSVLSGLLHLFAATASVASSAYLTVSGELWVVDTASNQVSAIIVGAQGPGVAVAPAGDRIYVTNQFDDSVSVFDGTANRLLKTLRLTPQRTAAIDHTRAAGPTPTATVIPPKPIGSEPVGIAVTADGSRVFVAAIGAVLVIDTTTDAVVDTFPLPLLSEREVASQGIAVSADQRDVYVVNHNRTTSPVAEGSVLSHINVPTREVRTISLPGRPVAVAVHPDGTRVYVTTNFYDPFNPRGAIEIIDPHTNSVMDSVFNPAGALSALAVTADGTRVVAGPALFVMDAQTHAVLLARNLIYDVGDISLTPDGLRAYTPRSYTIPYTLSAFDIASGEMTSPLVQLGCGARAFGAFIGPDVTPLPTPTPVANDKGAFGYVVNGLSNSVSTFRSGTAEAGDTIPVAFGPRRIALSLDGRRAYVTHQDGNRLSEIDTAQRAVIRSFAVMGAPYDIAISADNRLAFVTLNRLPGGIAVVDLQRGAVLQTLPVQAGEIEMSADRSTLYALAGNSVVVIDVATRQTRSVIPAEGVFRAVASGDGKRLYALTGSQIDVIDLQQQRVITTMAVDAVALALSADGRRLYASTEQETGVDVIDTESLQALGMVPAGRTREIALSSDGSLAYAVSATGSVLVIDTATLTELRRIPAGCSAEGIAIAERTVEPVAERCVGDCNADNAVTIDELVLGVSFLLGEQYFDTCTLLDSNGDRAVDITEVITAVNNALRGCPVSQ